MTLGLLAKYSLLGSLVAAISFFEPAIIFPALLIFMIVLFIRTRPEEDRSSLTKIVLVASLFRLLFFFVGISYVYFNYLAIYEHGIFGKMIGHSIQAVRDFEREIMNGKLIAMYFKGYFGRVPINSIAFEGHFFLHFGAYFQGMLNYLFGESIFNLLSFPIISLWVVIVSYYLGKEVFNKHVAASTALIIAILPSINMWSTTNIRTTLGIFGILLMAYSLTLFIKKNSPRVILPLIISVIIFSTAKDRLLRPVLLVIFLVLFLGLNIRLRVKAIILAVVGLAVIFLVATNESFHIFVKDILGDLIASQVGFSSVGGKNYKIYDEMVYGMDTVKTMPIFSIIGIIFQGLPKGLLYFLFSPFPVEVDNSLRLFAYPQMIFWYFMFFFSIIGFFRAFLERNSKVLPSVYIYSFFVVLFSLTLGNEGISARFRDLICPFFYMFASFTLCGWFLPAKESKE